MRLWKFSKSVSCLRNFIAMKVLFDNSLNPCFIQTSCSLWSVCSDHRVTRLRWCPRFDELEGGRNHFWCWKVMKLWRMHRISFPIPAQPTQVNTAVKSIHYLLCLLLLVCSVFSLIYLKHEALLKAVSPSFLFSLVSPLGWVRTNIKWPNQGCKSIVTYLECLTITIC